MDEKQLEDWLNYQIAKRGEEEGRQIAIWIAHRVGRRVLPLVWDAFTYAEWSQKYDLTALPLLWCNSVSAVACKDPTVDITEAAASAAYAHVGVDAANASASASVSAASAAASAIAARSAAHSAAHSAARSADAAASAASWNVISKDIDWIEAGHSVAGGVQPALWHDAHNPIQDEWHTLRQKLEGEEGNPWAFFIEWYERDLRGDPPDWDVLRALAANDPDTIKACESDDLAQVNAIIDAVRFEQNIQSQTPMGEDIRVDPDSLKLMRHATLPMEGLDLGAFIQRILNCLDRIKRDCSTGHNTRITVSVDLDDFWERIEIPFSDLRDELNACSNDAVGAHSAVQNLLRYVAQIESELSAPLPANLKAHFNAISDLAIRLRTENPALLDIVKKMEHERFRVLHDTHREQFFKIVEGMIRDSDGELKAALSHALGVMSDPHADEEVQRDALYTLVGRTVRGAKAQKSFREKFVKAADDVAKIDAGAETLSDWAREIYTQIASGNYFGIF